MSHLLHTGHPLPEFLDLPMSDAAWVAAVDAEFEPERVVGDDIKFPAT